ncbi:MAG: hypothetical protein IJ225_07725 [Solobacterium sp.]|nr:hypothetical protein [Solobacterium sp.]
MLWNKLWRSSCFEGVRFPVGERFEDISTVYRLFLNAEKVTGMDLSFYHYSQSDTSISHSAHAQVLIDYWNAHVRRYQSLMEKVEYYEDSRLEQALLKCVAYAAQHFWINLNFCKDRNDEGVADAIKEIHQFVSTHIPLTGAAGWPLILRYGIMLCHFRGTWSRAIAHWSYRLFLLWNNRTHS